MIKDCEKFVCKLYNYDILILIDMVWFVLFGKLKSFENMFLISDVLFLYIKRVYY